MPDSTLQPARIEPKIRRSARGPSNMMAPWAAVREPRLPQILRSQARSAPVGRGSNGLKGSKIATRE